MNRFLFACLLALICGLPGCQFGPTLVACEDGTTPGPTDTVPASLQQLYAQLGAPVQTFTYDPSRANTFTGTKGTTISIPAGAFVKGGQAVTAPVQLSFREIFSRADMVLSNMPTVSGGRVLESAGEVYLRAAQDTSLRMAAGTSILLQTRPANLPARDSMQLFVGRSGGSSCFNWTLNADPGSSLAASPGGNRISVSSILYNQGLDWFNCDRFYANPNLVQMTVNVSGNSIDPVNNTMVFAVFRGFNGAMRICDFQGPNTFTSGGAPIGSPVSVIVIRTVDAKLYYGRQNGTVQHNVPFAPVLAETTPAALITDLNSL